MKKARSKKEQNKIYYYAILLNPKNKYIRILMKFQRNFKEKKIYEVNISTSY